MNGVTDPRSGPPAWHPDWGPGRNTGPIGDRSRWRPPWWVTTILAVTLAAGGVWAWVALIEPRTSTAFCRETTSIRLEIAEASEPADESITAAVAAVAAARAPALVEQAESIGGSTGDEAEAIAAALTDIAASDTIENQRDPMTRFVELDNEFRRRHCDDDDRKN